MPSGVDEGMLPVRAAEGPSVEKRAKSRGRTGRPRKSDLKVIKMIMKWGPGGEQWFMKQKGSGRPKKGEEVSASQIFLEFQHRHVYDASLSPLGKVVRFQVPFSMVVRQDPWQYRYVDGHLETIDETAYVLCISWGGMRKACACVPALTCLVDGVTVQAPANSGHFGTHDLGRIPDPVQRNRFTICTASNAPRHYNNGQDERTGHASTATRINECPAFRSGPGTLVSEHQSRSGHIRPLSFCTSGDSL